MHDGIGHMYTPQAGTSPSRYTPVRYTPWQVHPPEQVHPAPRQVPPWQVHLPSWSMSGRYASYWNAFSSKLSKKLFFKCAVLQFQKKSQKHGDTLALLEMSITRWPPSSVATTGSSNNPHQGLTGSLLLVNCKIKRRFNISVL